MAVCSAVSMSSVVLPGAAVNVVVTGSIVLSGVSPLRAVRTLVSALLTEVAVIGARVVLVNPANHAPGSCIARLATIRSVSGETFTVPQLVAIEW